MKKNIKILTLGLLAAMLISACGPVTTPPPAQPESPPQQVDSAPANTDEPEAAPSDAPAEAQTDEPPMAVPTSRGDQLEATDPSTVALASGDLQLVEFFRFT